MKLGSEMMALRQPWNQGYGEGVSTLLWPKARSQHARKTWVCCDQLSTHAEIGAGSTGRFWPQQHLGLSKPHALHVSVKGVHARMPCSRGDLRLGRNFPVEHAASPKSSWLAFRGGCGWYKNSAPKCVRNLVPGRLQSASGEPGRAGEGRHVLECCTIFSPQRICSREKMACNLQCTTEEEATVWGEFQAVGSTLAPQTPSVVLEKELRGHSWEREQG